MEPDPFDICVFFDTFDRSQASVVGYHVGEESQNVFMIPFMS